MDKNSTEKKSAGSFEDELILGVKKAVTEDDVIAFEAKLNQTFPRQGWIKKRWISVAAVFIAVSAFTSMVWFLGQTSGKRLFGQYYVHYSAEKSSGIFRGEQDLKAEAIGFYSGEEYNNAVEMFQQVLHVNPADYESKFLLAISLTETGRFEEAFSHMQMLIDSPAGFYTDDALWYGSLLSIRLSDFVNAREFLAQIEKSSEYYPVALELLDKIKDNK